MTTTPTDYKHGEPEPFSVTTRLNLAGTAEFLGIRHRLDGPPVAALRVCGVDLEFTDPDETARFASAAEVMAAYHRIAAERDPNRTEARR